MTAKAKRITGLLLAGGQSRRMAQAFEGKSQGDKGLLDLAGKPMLATKPRSFTFLTISSSVHRGLFHSITFVWEMGGT